MSFTLDVSKYVAKTKKNVNEVIQGTAISLYRSIILDTPVDTGRLVGNWFVTKGSPSTKTVKGVMTAPQAVDRMTKVVEGKESNVYYLTNNLPYAYRIEYEGWSKNKAPQGMVRKNINRFNALLEQEARKYK